MAQYKSIDNVEQQFPPTYLNNENQTQTKNIAIDFIQRQSVFVYYFNRLIFSKILPMTTNIYIKIILGFLIILIDYSLFFGLIIVNCLSIYYGVIYDDCKYKINIYLIVMGSFGLYTNLFIRDNNDKQIDDYDYCVRLTNINGPPKCYNIFCFLIKLFMIYWFIIGSVWTYTSYFNNYECNTELLTFTFWLISIEWIIFASFISIFMLILIIHSFILGIND